MLLGLRNTPKDSLSAGGSNKLQDLCACLSTFYNEFNIWMAELDFEGQGDSKPANSHRLALYNLMKPYSEIIVTETRAKSSSKRPIGEIIVSNIKGIAKDKDVVGTDYISTRMNHHIGTYCDAKRLKDDCQKEFVFIDILRKASNEAAETLNK